MILHSTLQWWSIYYVQDNMILHSTLQWWSIYYVQDNMILHSTLQWWSVMTWWFGNAYWPFVGETYWPLMDSPLKGTVMQNFDVSFVVTWHKVLNIQCQWFESPQRLCFVTHDDVIKWKHFPRYWPFVRGIHRSLVNSPHKGQWRGALMFSLICVWINGWVNNHEAGDLGRYRAHYDVTVMVMGKTDITKHS